MKVTLETDANNFIEKYKDFLPEGVTEVKEVYEFEAPWYRSLWWSLKWWQFVLWLCEIIIPDLKNEPNKIWFGHKNSGVETNQTK